MHPKLPQPHSSETGPELTAWQTPPRQATADPVMAQQSAAVLQGDSANAQHLPLDPQKSAGVQQETPAPGQEAPGPRHAAELLPELELLLELTELELPELELLVELTELELLLELRELDALLEPCELEPCELELMLELELELLLELPELELLLEVPEPHWQTSARVVGSGRHS
jgi:hypothetical protein